MAKITIVGAGLSGMVAAADLARQGYEVTVLEREKKIGGSPGFHPSLHATPIDLGYTSEFIGVDISGCFQLLTDLHTWVRNKRIYSGMNNYGVERGARETSIDSYLYRICLEQGVKFEFGQSVDNLRDVPPGSIVATGLMCTMNDFSDHKRVSGHGWAFLMESKLGPASWQYSDVYSPDYFYAVAMNGILYGLVFGREVEIEKKWLDLIDQQFYDREGIEIQEWKPFSCEIMTGKRLFFGPGNNYIMTGSASGSMDPYFGFGIVGAMTSGKISALAVRDPDRAQVLFEDINRHHTYLYYLFEAISLMPQAMKFKLFEVMPSYYRYLKPIFGPMGYGIPGYPRDWMAEFTKGA